MKIIQVIFFACQVLLLNPFVFADSNNLKGIAVVKSQFDRINKVLSRYKIPFTMLQRRDLEKKEIYNRYRTIFFPCGIDKPVETNVNILSRGTRIQAVSLKKRDFSELDREKIYNNIDAFISEGGVGYFSGYSYEFLQGAFKPFEFFDNFPNMGMAGKINIYFKNELHSFCRKKNLSLNMPHSGWIAVKSIDDADVLAEGSFETPKGKKFAPIIAFLKRGEGGILYTSYHNNLSDKKLLRYMVYRVSYCHILNNLLERARIWEQEVMTSVIDSVREWESCRIYSIVLSKGANSIYFKSEAGFFQVDVFDHNSRLIVSRDSGEREFFINIDAHYDGAYILRVYPSPPVALGAYALVSAQGLRLFPYYKIILLLLVLAALVFVIVWIKRFIFPDKFSGIIRQK